MLCLYAPSAIIVVSWHIPAGTTLEVALTRVMSTPTIERSLVSQELIHKAFRYGVGRWMFGESEAANSEAPDRSEKTL